MTCQVRARSDGPGKSNHVALEQESLQVECIEDETRFGALRAEWNHLARRGHHASVFLHHEWFDAAWQWRRLDSALRILRVHDGSNTVAFCPFVLRTLRRSGIRLRALELLTVPDTQLCDLLVAPQDQAAAIDALERHLCQTRRQWDVIMLDFLPNESAAAALLRATAVRHGLPCHVAVAHDNFFINLTSGWQTFYASRSRRLKKANNLNGNRLRRAVREIEVKWYTASDLDDSKARKILQEIVGVSARSWKRKTGLSLDNRGPHAFLESILGHARGNEWLSVWILSLDGHSAAIEFQLIYQGQIYALRADYDEAFKELSPGSYLNWKLIEGLVESGMDRYWLGPGANAYKLHWTDDRIPLHKVTLYGDSLRARLAALLELRLRRVAKGFARGARTVVAR